MPRLLFSHTSRAIEFVVADRDSDGKAERIRYDWSGTPGDPLNKTVNGGTPVAVLASVQNFQLTFFLDTKTTALTPNVDTSEGLLASNTSTSGSDTMPIGVNAGQYSCPQRLNPTVFSSVPAGATCWNVTE